MKKKDKKSESSIEIKEIESNPVKRNIRKPSKTESVVISILLVTGIGVGTGAGIFFGNSYFASKNGIDYSSMSIQDFEDDVSALMKKYDSTSTSDYTTKFEPYELASIGLAKVKAHDYVMQQSFGQVNAMGVKQVVRSASIKENDKYFLENLSSSSLVSVAKRFYQSGDEIKTFDGSKAEVEKATWSADPLSILSIVEHEEKWGRDIARPSIYIVSSKTTLPTSTAEKTSTGYSVSLDLHPVFSVLRYVKQMTEISGVEAPNFKTINIVYTLDERLNLIKTTVTETYSVVMVVKAESEASLEEYFTYDQHVAIPDLNTDITYSKEA